MDVQLPGLIGGQIMKNQMVYHEIEMGSSPKQMNIWMIYGLHI
jgi:hypothetical protein